MSEEQSFSDLEKAAWGGLLGVHGRLMRMIDADLLSNFNISHVEFEVLLRLSWQVNHRARIQDLATQSVLTRSGINRVVERLEGMGLVRREKAPEDKRGAYAILTESGETRFQQALSYHVLFVRHYFLQHFSDDELRQMSEFWQRIETNLNP